MARTPTRISDADAIAFAYSMLGVIDRARAASEISGLVMQARQPIQIDGVWYDVVATESRRQIEPQTKEA